MKREEENNPPDGCEGNWEDCLGESKFLFINHLKFNVMKTSAIFVFIFFYINICFSQKISDNKQIHDNDNYILIKFKDKIINNGEIVTFYSGEHIRCKSLIIKKGGVLQIVGDSLWWRNNRKFCILEVEKELIIEGKILVTNWYNPFFDDKWDIKIDSLAIKEEFNKIKLNHVYKFGKGGKGGDAGHGNYGANDRNGNPLAKTFGNNGDLKSGGSGGGGYGYVDGYPSNTQHERYCIRGLDAIDGGNGGGGLTSTGGNGGKGGLTPFKGIGGLLLILCKSKIISNGLINIQGLIGNDGCNGTNSSPAGTVGGGGAGGGGSAGLPGGKLYIISKMPVGTINILKESVEGGKRGEPGQGYVLGQTAEPGQKGDNGKAGSYENIIFPIKK